MNHPIVQNTWRLSLYVGVFLLAGLIYAGAISPLVPISIGFLLVDGLISSLLYGLLTLPLWVVIKYAKYANEPLFQKIMAYAVFCVLLLVFWLALLASLLYLFFPYDVFLDLTTKTFAIKAMLGLVSYVSLVLVYINFIKNEIAEEEIAEEETEIIPAEQSETMSNQVELIERISVKLGNKIHIIAVTDICHLQSEGDYVMIYDCDGGHYLKEQTMKYFEEHLPRNKFVRIHRSCIVNVEIISRVELYEKQHYLVTLQNGQQLKASMSGYKLLRKTLSL